jgi:hypothetical protein
MKFTRSRRNSRDSSTSDDNRSLVSESEENAQEMSQAYDNISQQSVVTTQSENSSEEVEEIEESATVDKLKKYNDHERKCWNHVLNECNSISD